MGIPILVIGKSGSGKSASLRSFGENDVSVVNVLGKPLPFRAKVKNTDLRRFDIKDKAGNTQDVDSFYKTKYILGKSKALSLVIDDAGYLLTNMFMDNIGTKKKGEDGFAVYNDMGKMFKGLIDFVSDMLPPEKIVYFIMHEDVDDVGTVIPKSMGKLLTQKVCIEGMFTICLRSLRKSDGRYIFRTQTDGADVAKTPMDMFDGMEIDNDLKAVDAAIREYYGLNGENKKGEGEND